jgi:hypothetical protein
VRLLGFLLALGVGLVAGGPVAAVWAAPSAAAPSAAAPAVATTAAATTSGDASLLEPTLSCTSPNDPGTGVDTTVFGYVNHSHDAVRLDPGPWNLVLGATDAKAPIVFQPGRHPRAFEVHVNHGQSARWELGAGTAVGPGPRCKGRLSPAVTHSIMRSVTIWGVPLAFIYFVFAYKSRRDRKRAKAGV